MNDIIHFESKRKCKIWMYTVSHSTLIVRSEKQYSDVEYDYEYDDPNTTIDLIFNGVDFISIPHSFEEISIKNINGKFIFNNNENWYVDAANCWIGKYQGEDINQMLERDIKYDELRHL